MSLVVTGTGTSVGKTVVSALLLARYGSARGLDYWKPIATGSREDAAGASAGDVATVRRLAGRHGEVLAETYLFSEPLSPHLAARLEGRAIDPARVLAEYRRHRARGHALLIEGAGGLLVPLTEGAPSSRPSGQPALEAAAAPVRGLLLADLLASLGLPCVLVATSALGTINHTLLTLEAMAARGLAAVAVVLNGPRNEENRKAIERFGGVPVLEVTPLARLDPAEIDRAAAGFDPAGLLAPLLVPGARGGLAGEEDGGGEGEIGGHTDWREADRRHVWHPYTQMLTAPPPLPVARAQGVYLHLTDGRRVLDGISSWWVNIHGHNHPRLNRALAAQSRRLEQVIFAGFCHEPAARLAAALTARAPGRLPWVFYSDDGSTSVEVALKMACQHWRHRGEPGRNLFVAFDDAYHGDTFGAMAASGPSPFNAAFGDLLFEVRRAATPDSSRRGSTSPPLGEILAREGGRVAAVIIEPVLQGAGGMRVQPPEFLREVREQTRLARLPLIADEVLTGFGRTGRLFACEHGPIAPDLLCLSKALTGGYLPLAATLASAEIYDSFLSPDRGHALFHGHSYTANALACAVALESLALFEEEDRLGRVGELERLFAARLERLSSHPRVARTRAIGGMAALEVSVKGSGGYLDEVGPRLARELLARDILLRPLGEVLYVLPPYVITDEEVERVFLAIEQALDRL